MFVTWILAGCTEVEGEETSGKGEIQPSAERYRFAEADADALQVLAALAYDWPGYLGRGMAQVAEEVASNVGCSSGTIARSEDEGTVEIVARDCAAGSYRFDGKVATTNLTSEERNSIASPAADPEREASLVMDEFTAGGDWRTYTGEGTRGWTPDGEGATEVSGVIRFSETDGPTTVHGGRYRLDDEGMTYLSGAWAELDGKSFDISGYVREEGHAFTFTGEDTLETEFEYEEGCYDVRIDGQEATICEG